MKFKNTFSKIMLVTLALTSLGTISINISNANGLNNIQSRCVGEEQTEYIVTTKTSSLNMRTGPGTNYSIVTKIPKDSIITKISNLENNWAKTVYTTPQGVEYIGYVFYGSGYATRANFSNYQYGEITGNRVIFRNEGNRYSNRLGYVNKGDRAYALDNPNNNGYYKVWILSSNNGIKVNTGYVHKDYFKANN